MIITEDGVPTTTTGGPPALTGPVAPIKMSNVDKGMIRRAAKLKTKKRVTEELNITTDILYCEETGEMLFLDES